MSDFLSNFSGDNYEKTRQEKLYDKEKEKKKKKKSKSKPLPEEATQVLVDKAPDQANDVKKTPLVKKKKSKQTQTGEVPYGPVNVILDEDFEKRKKHKKPVTKKGLASSSDAAIQSDNEPLDTIILDSIDLESTVLEEPTFEQEADMAFKNSYEEEVIEKDPTYQKKKRRKYAIIGILAVLAASVLFFIYYQMTHVAVPNFKGKELADARTWTTENDVKLKVEQKYDFKMDANLILKQSVTKGKIKKGTELVVEASLGPDPEEVIPLPDFKAMKEPEAKKWISEHKTDGLVVIDEYSDTIAAGEFVKFEMTTKDVKAETYKRKDKGKIYFSKGKEVYEKDIPVPDFAGKMKDEVSDWAKKNEIQLKIEEADSDTVEVGKIISQSIAKDQKIAKKETITVTVSKGKAFLVPDFSQYTLQEAEAQTEGLQLQIKQTFNESVPYGRFIGQSIEAGTKFNEKAEKPVIQVTYSAGKPFLKDLKGTTLEGDLQKIFYDDYQSKGANITYQVYYVDSSVTKGTVVQMSKYNEFVPIDYVVQIGISRGNLQPSEPDK